MSASVTPTYTYHSFNTLASPKTSRPPATPMPLVTAQNENDCTVGEVEEGTTLIGFPGDDVCVQAT